MSKLKRFIAPVFILLIIAFFALYLRDIDYSTFEEIEFNWSLLFVATIITLAFRYWGVVIWRYILRDLGAKALPPFVILSDVYAKAWMGRYIPGTVTWIAGKIYMASKLGISKSRLTVSSLLEGGMQVVASMFVSLLILGLDSRLDIVSPQSKILMIILALGSLTILLPPVFNRVISFGFKIIRKKEAYDELKTNFMATGRSFVLYTVGSVIMGSAYYFLVSALYPATTPDQFWYIVGAFTLAGALGMATPFVPSGLGVRDGVQLVLLSAIMPKEIALTITVFSRLWSAASDVLFYAIAQAIRKLLYPSSTKNRGTPK